MFMKVTLQKQCTEGWRPTVVVNISVSNPKKCHFLHFFGHIEIHRNLKTSKRPFKLKQSNKVSFLGATLKKNQIASVGVSMFFYVTKKTSKYEHPTPNIREVMFI